jgi:general secretion pathway protein G
MVVLILVAGVAAVVGQTVFNTFGNANVRTTRMLFKEVEKQLELYNADCGSFPTTDQGLQALVTEPGADVCTNWGPNPYFKQVPKDAWGRSLIYDSDGSSFVLKSLGSDRKEGGTGTAKDLLSTDSN